MYPASLMHIPPPGTDPDDVFLSAPKHRLPRCRYSPQRDWEPLSDDEWAVLVPSLLRSAGPGRPVRDPRARLDAIFWVAAGPQRRLKPWHTLPPEFGKPDTVARQFRRWAAQGLWSRLLRALADPDYPGIAVLRRLESWICRTHRRAWSILGAWGVALARRIGFLSAMRAPSVLLPDPDLSEYVKNNLLWAKGLIDRHGLRAGLAKLPCPDFFKVCNTLLWTAGGGRRVSRYVSPPCPTHA